MDIDLLSKMILELILDNDEVTLPGVGTFVAEVMPSTFSDKGYTINPPYRKLSFRQRASSDISLIDFYARSNGLDTRTASSIMLKFLEEMTEILRTRKAVVLPGLGRLRATKENNFFFIADEDLNIYPEGFGLEPVSLKTHVETEDDVEAAVSGLQSILDEGMTVPEPASEPVADDAVLELEAVESEAAAAEATPVLETGEVFIEPLAAPLETAAEPVETEPEPVETDPEAVEPAETEQEAVVEPEEAGPEAVDQVSKPADRPRVFEPWNESMEHDAPVMMAPPKSKGYIVVLAVIAALLLLLGLFVLLAHVAPDFTDRLLYSPEELEILRQI